MKYGYIRISSDDQSEVRQKKSLIEAGVPEHNIFCDVMSGKNFNRPQYKKLKKIAKSGDTIVFHELDRFGRNFKEGKEEVDYFQKNNIRLVFLDMEFLSAMADNNDVFVQFMGYVQVMTALIISEKERERLKKRQLEGVEIAKENGKYKGRVKKYHKNHLAMNAAVEDYYNRSVLRITVNDICKKYQVSRSALYRKLDELKEKDELLRNK
jgi:DNA invertase Pin-like site-specific DNA recombinase